MIDRRPVDFSPLAEDQPDILTIIDGKNSLRLNRLGARSSLKLDGVQILTGMSAKRYDGKPAVSHPCTPNFGPFGKEFGLKQHGPGRSSFWELVDSNQELNGGSVVLGLDIEQGTYPQGIHVDYEASLKNGVYGVRTVHSNTGKSDALVNFGHHLYWDTGYRGWEEVLLNGNNIAELIMTNRTTNLLEENKLHIPGKPEIVIRQRGLSRAVAWVMKHPSGLMEYDTTYFCLEPVENEPNMFGHADSVIKSGGSRETELTILLQQS